MNTYGSHMGGHGSHPMTHRSEHQLQLPSFQNLIRDVGQAELAHRGPLRLEPPLASPPATYTFDQHLPPTPPATSQGKQASDLFYTNGPSIQTRAYNGRREQEFFDSSRRASSTLPATSRPTAPRPNSAYSNNQVRPDASRYEPGWQHGRIVAEEEPAIIDTCFVPEESVIFGRGAPVERVNPKWGTTKAGKPRKRLGQACNTCREKKTKCDPGYPKCSQCQRFNRECRFDQNSRQSHRSPELRGSTRSPHTASTGIGTQSPSDSLRRRTPSSIAMEIVSPTDLQSRVSPESPGSFGGITSPAMTEKQVNNAHTPSKRPRLDAGESGFAAGQGPHFSEQPLIQSHSSVAAHREFGPLLGHESTLIQKYLSTWLEHINTPTLDVMPQQRFSDWVLSDKPKSMHDRIMIYAILTAATSFSSVPEATRLQDRATMKRIIYQHLDDLEHTPCLQLVHTLLYLAISELHEGYQSKGCAVLGRCFAAAGTLRMHTELPTNAPPIEAYEFPTEVAKECRRRTFWAMYCIDTLTRVTRFNCPVIAGFETTFLRLPCTRNLYDQGQIPVLPVFDIKCPESDTSTLIADRRNLSTMAYLVQILSINLAIVQNDERGQLSFRTTGKYIQSATKRETFERMLKGWAEGYTAGLRATYGKTPVSEPPGPRDSQLYGARACKFAGYDFFYHSAHLELNRRILQANISQSDRKTRVQQGRLHAGLLLKLAQQLLDRGGAETEEYNLITKTPGVGSVLLSSIDIITAAGSTEAVVDSGSGLMASLYTGIELLEKLGTTWPFIKEYHSMARARIHAVFSAAQAAVTEGKAYFYFLRPIVPMENQDLDLAYGGDRLLYLRLVLNAPAEVRENQVRVI